MDVGNEISHKIRSAIKAKLVELGAYVDEELPDYIMVMVANKKTQFQMSEDLGLFLGTNTEKFTTWLHSLLLKLQSITSDTAIIGKLDKSEKSKSKDTPSSSSAAPTTDSSTSGKSKRRHNSDEGKPKSSDESKPKKRHSNESSDLRKEEKRRKSDLERKRSVSESSDSALKEKDQNHEEYVPSSTDVSTTREQDVEILEITEVDDDKSEKESVVLIDEGEIENEQQVSTATKVTEEIQTKDVEETEDAKETHPAKPAAVVQNVRQVDDDDLSAELLLTENDELAEELELEPAVLTVVKKKSESNRAAVVNVSDDEEPAPKPRVRGAASIIVSRSSRLDDSPPRSSVVSRSSRLDSSPPRSSIVSRSSRLDDSPPRATRIRLDMSPPRSSVVSRSSRLDDSPPRATRIRLDTSPPRSSVASRSSRLDSSPPRSARVRLDTSPPRSSRPRAVTSPIRQTVHRTAVRVVEPRPIELFTRKRRGPVSVVGSITRDSDDEQEYDPHNPAVGSVASVIKVTARKSSIPPKLQANKSLLLKAMSEAEKSVESQRRVAITPIRPFMRSERRSRSRERDRERGEREREREREKNNERSSRSKSGTSSSRDAGGSGGLRLAQTSFRQAISQPGSKRSDPPVYIPTRKVQPTRVDGGGDRDGDQVGIISKSKREAEKQRTWLDEEIDSDDLPARKCIKKEKDLEPGIVNFVIEAEVEEKEEEDTSAAFPAKVMRIKQERVSPQRNTTLKKTGSVIDSRVVEYEPEMVPSPEGEDKLSDVGSPGQGVPLLLEDMDQDEFTLDQDVIELTDSSHALLDSDLRQTMGKDSAKAKDKTRFVVTLDGVDSDQYDMEVGVGGRYEDQMAVVAPSVNQVPPVSRSASQQSFTQAKDAPLIRSPPKIQPMNISLKDSDEEGEGMETEDITPLKQAKMLERCKFWPACINGVSCEYHHPTVHCKTFPACKFGDKCLYIHPNCKFDSKCTRLDCPFTHSSRRSIPTSFAAPQVVYQAPPPRVSMSSMAPRVSGTQCRFFPNCSNVTCPFYHPKPCRFGLACKNKVLGCPFYHPSLPTKDKLSWAAPSKLGTTTTSSVSVVASVGK